MKADLHLHTNFSRDGVSSPKEVVEAAIKNGVDIICVTDHGEIKGAVEAARYAFDKNLLVIPGIEILSKSGDILGINIKKIIPNGLSAKETIEEIHRQGGIAIIPHPFQWPNGAFLGGEEELLLADAIEIFNANSLNFTNKAFEFVTKNELPFSAGSDAHKAKFVGRGHLEFHRSIGSEKELTEEIKNKGGKVSGKILSLWETIENSRKMNLLLLFDYFYESRLKRGKS